MAAPLRPLHPSFGVESREVLRGSALQQALDSHRLVLFRGTALDDDDQVDLMRGLGEPMLENPHRKELHSFVSHTREEGILGDAAYAFHSDHAFMPDPIEYLSLAAVEVSPGCGGTRFADMVGAAAALPEPLRDALGGRVGQNIIDPSGEPDVVRMGCTGHDALPQSAHPALLPHPRTGAETLFVNEQQTEYLSDLSRAESDALLGSLFEHLYSDDFVYAHEWEPGDLIVWDNRALQHARPRLDSTRPRTLRRVSVGGSSVFEFFEQANGPMHRLEDAR